MPLSCPPQIAHMVVGRSDIPRTEKCHRSASVWYSPNLQRTWVVYFE